MGEAESIGHGAWSLELGAKGLGAGSLGYGNRGTETGERENNIFFNFEILTHEVKNISIVICA
jgi:hypothetical protein